jgi:hypothetical protein
MERDKTVPRRPSFDFVIDRSRPWGFGKTQGATAARKGQVKNASAANLVQIFDSSRLRPKGQVKRSDAFGVTGSQNRGQYVRLGVSGAKVRADSATTLFLPGGLSAGGRHCRCDTWISSGGGHRLLRPPFLARWGNRPQLPRLSRLPVSAIGENSSGLPSPCRLAADAGPAGHAVRSSGDTRPIAPPQRHCCQAPPHP